MNMLHEKGYWVGEKAAGQHCYDPKLSEALLRFFKERDASVVDLGCGLGDYLKHFRKNGLTCCGYDGNPKTPELTDNHAGVADLTEPLTLEPKPTWIMSLEVGEHLPAQYEDQFIQNLHANNTQGILLSWAVKGQGGYGHVNEQDNGYIKAKFAALGYKNNVEVENQLRAQASNAWWFRHTIMVFEKCDREMS